MNILYATDGSHGALAAAHFLARLPLGDDCQIHLLSVIEVDGGEGEANDVLARTREALGETRARIRNCVRRGDPAQQILEQVHHGGGDDATAEILDDVDGVPDDDPLPDLVVVGTHGRSAVARFFVGSVADRVARHAPCSVLLARPRGDGGGELGPIVVGLDGSESAARALDWLTRRLPLPSGGEIRLVRAVTPPAFLGYADGALLVPGQLETLTLALQQEAEDARTDLARTADELKGEATAGAAARTIVAEALPGDAASVLLDAAHDHNAGLLVVGSHGSTGLERFLLGSVSEKVLRHAECSVLVVR